MSGGRLERVRTLSSPSADTAEGDFAFIAPSL